MTPVSICVIMKNEEKNMEKFLSAIKRHFGNYPYELVLVDTGSTDNTLQIAGKYTDQIFHFDWIGDFSAARNFSIACASHDWILALDCDEYILDLDTKGFDAMIRQYPDSVGMLSRKNHYAQNGTDSIYTDDVERFFNRKRFHYEAIIHEQVRAIDGSPFQRTAIPLTVDHCGYNGTEEELKKKADRNNELLLKMLEQNPDDPYLYFQIGQSYNPRAEYVQMMVIGYGYALLHLKRYDEALQFQNIYEEFGGTADFVCLMGLIYLRKGMIVQAMAEFLKATTFETARTEGANSFIPIFNMGCINEVLGEREAAVSHYKRCGSFRPALDRLRELEDI